jgi:hypothetical protein
MTNNINSIYEILCNLFGDDISKIIVSKLNFNKCIFENCFQESIMMNKYCKRHWCKDGHPTSQKKYIGYCNGCFTKIIKTDKKRYQQIITRK